MKKYKLRSDLKLELGSLTLHQIERLDDGVLGGFIEKESNLSQSGNSWVHGNAQVYGKALVSGDAQVYGEARVYDHANVSGDAQVYGDAWVSGSAHVYGEARVYDHANVSGDARVCGDAMVSGNSQIYGDARIDSNSSIFHCVISSKFNITVTPQNAVVGCSLKKRSDWLKMSIKEAEIMGLPKELYPQYRRLIKTGMKLVPRTRGI